MLLSRFGRLHPCTKLGPNLLTSAAEARTVSMKIFSFGLVLAFLTFAPLSGKSSPQSNTREADIHELERLEIVWNEAHEHGDADTLAGLWADDMEIAVPKMPVLTESDALKFARSGRMKFLSYRTSDIHVRVYGDAAVVTGRLQRTRSMNGQEVSDDWRFTKTYIRESQKWRVVAFHASEAAQP